jgi:Ca2+-binding EF-hand superfamily protein
MSKLNAPQGKRVNIAESNAVLNANMTIPERVQLMFDKYDTDGSGKINAKEFRNLTMDMGYYFTDEELEMQLRVFDTKTDGELEFKEVLEWYKTDARFKKALVGPSTLRKVEKLSIQFKKFDRDNSGEIDALEFNALYDALTKIGFIGNKNDVRRQLDKTGDGKISFNEFVQFFLENTK